jgi:hypothetical protein
VPRAKSPHTQENFDKIHEGVREADMRALLGNSYCKFIGRHEFSDAQCVWHDGPSYILVRVSSEGEYLHKRLHIATALERLEWSALKAADKIGVS